MICLESRKHQGTEEAITDTIYSDLSIVWFAFELEQPKTNDPQHGLNLTRSWYNQL